MRSVLHHCHRAQPAREAEFLPILSLLTNLPGFTGTTEVRQERKARGELEMQRKTEASHRKDRPLHKAQRFQSSPLQIAYSDQLREA